MGLRPRARFARAWSSAITTTCSKRRFWVDEQRKLGFDGLKFRMPEWRRVLYDYVIVLQCCICAQNKALRWGDCVFCCPGFLTPSKPIFVFIKKPLMERQRIFSKRASWSRQNTWKLYTEPLLMLYKVEWVYLLEENQENSSSTVMVAFCLRVVA